MDDLAVSRQSGGLCITPSTKEYILLSDADGMNIKIFPHRAKPGSGRKIKLRIQAPEEIRITRHKIQGGTNNDEKAE